MRQGSFKSPPCKSIEVFPTLYIGKQPEFEEVRTYFVPKLTEDELELVERKDPNYFK